MEKKSVLLICSEALFSDIVALIFDRLDYKVSRVDNPRDAVNLLNSGNSFDVVVIGENKGTVVKPKLAEIIYKKAEKKPYIIVFKKLGEVMPKESYITTIPKPTFHEEIIKVLEKAGSAVKPFHLLDKTGLDEFIKFPNFVETDVVSFFKNLKSNLKFYIKHDSKKVVGFTMGTDIFVLHSTIDDPYDIIKFHDIEAAIEPISLNEFLSLTLDIKTFKSNLRNFIVKSIMQLDDRGKLLKLLPDKNSIVTLKAPLYIVKQIDLINNNVDIENLHSSGNQKTIADLIGDGNDLERIKAVLCLYTLNMIEVEKPVTPKKYDVKIKKSFLKKIMDKIRGL